MAALEKWEEITPEELRPAIKHVRDLFDTGVWKCSELTEKLGYAALHPNEERLPRFAEYQEQFPIYRQIIGSQAAKEFDAYIRTGTPPSIFKAYLTAYQKGTEAEAFKAFREILQIGVANAGVLRTLPSDWALAHLRILITENSHILKIWIKLICDKHDCSSLAQTDEGVEEMMHWRKWRAPRLLRMQPAGNLPSNLTGAWAREDEETSLKILESYSHGSDEFLDIYVEKIAGDAHVLLAKQKPVAQPNNPPIRSAAPKPISPVRGHSWIPSKPKSSKPLLNFPSYYPNELRARTTVVIGEGIRKFPVQTEVFELCKYVIAELTPHFHTVVKSGKVREDMALSHMGDLLHSLLVSNCDDTAERFHLERKGHASDEWLEFAKRMAGDNAPAEAEDSPKDQIEAKWSDIEITFISDERVQINNAGKSETCNYKEFGFGDGRSDKPNRAWIVLRVLSQTGGVISDGARTNEAWPKMEKRIQDIRKILRSHFGITADPIPFVRKTGYQTSFKISRSPAFDS